MVTQSTTVVLQANVAGYIASLQSAAAATTNFANQGAAAVTHHQQSWDNAAKKMGAVGLGMAAGVGVVVKSYADFDKAMSAVKANVEATPAEFQKLSDSVRSAGTQFGFSAKESAAGAEELAKAGLSASQIMGGSLTGALTLAAAGGVSAGEAAETAATAMSMFGLEAKDVSRIADVLANGANQSTASVGSLSQALRQGGGVAASFGMSLDDTVATFAMFDQNGLKASDAGTSLKTMLTALANPSKKARAAMDELGVSAFDASGKFIGMAALQDQLKTKTANLTQEQRAQAFATIFGSDAMRAANVLFKDTKGFDTWAGGIKKTGTAAENARKRLDNLYGDLNKLKSAFLDAAIGSGSGGDGFLRPVIQGATSALSAINALPGPVKSVGFGLTAATAAALLLGAGLMKLISIAASVRAGILGMVATTSAWNAATMTNITLINGQNIALGRLGATIALIGARIPIIAAMQAAFISGAAGATRFATAAGVAQASLVGFKALLPVLLAVGAAFAAAKVTEWSAAAADGSHNAKEFAKSLTALANGSTQVSGEMAKFGKGSRGFGAQWTSDFKDSEAVLKNFAYTSRAHFSSINDGLNDWLGNIQSGNAKAESFRKSVKTLDGTLADMVANGQADKAAAAFKKFRSQIDVSKRGEFDKMFTKYNAALAEAKAKTTAVVSPTKQMADAISGVGKKSEEAERDVEDLAKAIKGLGSSFLDEKQGAIDYQSSLADVNKALQENGRNANIATKGGRENYSALMKLATDTQKWAAATYTQTGSMAQANGVMAAGKKQIEALGKAMGFTAPEIDKLTQSTLTLAGIPKLDIEVAVPGVEGSTIAVDKLGRKVYEVNGTNISVPVDAPNAQKIVQLLAGVKGSAMAADGQSVSVPVSSPTAPEAIRLLRGVEGAAVGADGKSVNIPTEALNASTTIGLLNSIYNAAIDRTQTITTVHVYKTVGRKADPDAIYYHGRGGQAIGGPAGIPSYATGGAARSYISGGRVSGPGTTTSDSILARMSSGLVRLSNLEHVLTAREVDMMGGHGAVYKMRAAARAGQFRVQGYADGGIPGYASGGVAAGSWQPDMSGIQAMLTALRVDPQTLTDSKGKVSSATEALAKAARDLGAARAKYRQTMAGKHTAAQEISARNKVADAVAKEAKAQRDLNSARATYATLSARSGVSAGREYSDAVGIRSKNTKRFLDDITAIAKVSPDLARALMEQGDDEAEKQARAYVTGPVAEMKRGGAAIRYNSSLEAQRKALSDKLAGTAGPSQLAENRAAQLAANQQLVALQAANQNWSRGGGVVATRVDIDYNRITDGVVRRIQVQPAPISVNYDGREIATTTTTYQSQQASYGSVRPGVE